MNQLAFAIGALAGLVCAAVAVALLWRLRRRPASPYDAQHLAVFEQWPTTAIALDPATMRWVSGNPASLRNLGLTLEELRARKFDDLFRAEGAEGRALLQKLQDATTRAPLEMHQRCADGSERNVEATCHRIEVNGQQLLAVAVHDVTIRRKVETQLLEKHQKLDHLAHHDHLTGLPNRLYLAAHLPGAIEEAKKNGTVLAVLFLDLDRFKHVNDSRGHETGDKLLKTVAQRVRSTIRADDLVVRMGGDEFVVVMRGIKSTDQVNEAAARINRALAAPMVVDGRTLVTTVSIGVALYPYDGADMGELLRQSDTAMYQAKDRGRNNYQLFSQSMDKRLKERIAIESSLRTALQSAQLDVHYQPIVDIESQRVVALEALLRWKHPRRGLIPPMEFIPIAEETGLIVPIGEWVLATACARNKAWQDQGQPKLSVAVNLSARQFADPMLLPKLTRIIHASGLDPSSVELEIT
ncbi:MAG TPA: diguanylate cyclase, partial [Steroidobacteraceae bacterium]|nr:diguanylate cyclase [Steroidobacteraceae bacterium]